VRQEWNGTAPIGTVVAIMCGANPLRTNVPGGNRGLPAGPQLARAWSHVRRQPSSRNGGRSVTRLSYRPISLDDFESYAEFLADPECTRYLLVPEPHSREVARSLLERNVAEHDGTIGMYSLSDGDELIGWAGFQRRELTGAPEVELGWLIRKEHWGHGYASEAALALQVLFRFATDDETTAALRAVQESGEAWMSGTTWNGRSAIRVSVSNWQTTVEDIDRTLAAYAGQLAAR
jgi:Acetyltransferase (GNAT) domain